MDISSLFEEFETQIIEKKDIALGIEIASGVNNCKLARLFLLLKLYLDKTLFEFTIEDFGHFFKDIILLSCNYNCLFKFVSAVDKKDIQIYVVVLKTKDYSLDYGIEYDSNYIEESDADDLAKYVWFYDVKRYLNLFNKENNSVFKNSLLSLKNMCRRKLVRMMYKCSLKNCNENEYFIDIKKNLNLNEHIYFFLFNFFVFEKDGIYISKIKNENNELKDYIDLKFE
jgi:hypothetical protein